MAADFISNAGETFNYFVNWVKENQLGEILRDPVFNEFISQTADLRDSEV